MRRSRISTKNSSLATRLTREMANRPTARLGRNLSGIRTFRPEPRGSTLKNDPLCRTELHRQL